MSKPSVANEVPTVRGAARALVVAVLAGMGSAATNASAQQAQPIAEGLVLPVDIAADPAVPTSAGSRFFVLEQKTGCVRVIEGGSTLPQPALTIPKDQLRSRGWEQGLLGIALAPDFASSRHLYLNSSGPRGQTQITRWTMLDDRTIDATSRQLLLEIRQPYDNHNGGCIRFGGDGMLYVGMGDGGSANDPQGAGQDLRQLLGKILRIDVTPGNEQPGKSYGIPKDNPFAHRDDALPEIWSYGVRNPWRIEFDSLGRLWIADVGQNVREWIHVQPVGSRGGENYGWNYREGSELFTRRPEGQRSVVPDDTTVKRPIWQYSHKDNNGSNGSITGGYFYEGDAVEALKDRYVFGDFMSGRVWSFKVVEGIVGPAADDVVEHTQSLRAGFGELGMELSISSFGKDNDNELYILDHKGGRLLKIVP